MISVVGCSDSSNNGNGGGEGSQMVGAFRSACFFNKAASDGIGQNIYTISEMSFGANQQGSNHYELYGDAACTNLLASGDMEISYVVEREVGGVKVLKMDQHDPNDSNNDLTFWIPTYSAGDLGFYADIDSSDGNSGPYFTNPSDVDIQDFIDNPTTDGILFSKQ